jgi:DNA polymerase
MSGAKFAWLCKSRNCRVETLEKAGLKPQEAVKVYRTTYPRIPQLWKDMHAAVHRCAGGHGDAEAGRCRFIAAGPDMHMVLPSGRPVVYRNVRVEMRVPGYCKLYGMPETPVPTVLYDHPRGYTGFLYGSKITENASQGICRDAVANALVNCEQEGLHPVFHVHDEIGSEDPPSKFHRFMEVMSDPPAWAEGFPLMAEGYSGPIWTKNAKGYEEAISLRGVVLNGR